MFDATICIVRPSCKKLNCCTIMVVGKLLRSLPINYARRRAFRSSSYVTRYVSVSGGSKINTLRENLPSIPSFTKHGVVIDRCEVLYTFAWCHHFCSTRSSGKDLKDVSSESEDETEEEDSDGWEDDDETEPEYGDGRAGGGVVLQNVPWGERVLSVAREVLLQFGDDMELFAFKVTPRGYIYVRLDKLSNIYGCPDVEELEKFHEEYKKRLDEIGESGDIPDNLDIEVSSPSAERLLKVPDDLTRFKDLPMRVSYVEEESTVVKESVFLLEKIDTESGTCEWKLAEVKANSNLTGKGRPLSRKLKDWRLKLPYAMFKKVSMYLD